MLESARRNGHFPFLGIQAREEEEGKVNGRQTYEADAVGVGRGREVSYEAKMRKRKGNEEKTSKG